MCGGAELVLTLSADEDSTAETVEEVAFESDAVWVQMATVAVAVDGAERLGELAFASGWSGRSADSLMKPSGFPPSVVQEGR